MSGMIKDIARELRSHAPFTIFGALLGVVILALVFYSKMSPSVSERLFEIFHPAHVLLSALATTGMYRLHTKARVWDTILVGYFGAIGIASISDCVIPYLGEYLLGLPNSHIHLGFIEHWWLVNPLAFLGIGIACFWPKTKFPHAGHVLLSTSASLFHMTMAMGEDLSLAIIIVVPVFLFLAVWLPCCASDIIFPLLFCKEARNGAGCCSHQKNAQ